MPTQIYRTANGERVPGVTTVISNLGWNKQALMYWANQQGLEGKSHRETVQKAADAGTLAHAYIEADLQGQDFPAGDYDQEIIDKAEQAFLNYVDWKNVVGFAPVGTEIPLVSESLGYGGCLDCVCLINGKHSLWDWKTSNGVYSEYLIQVAAYKALWEENNPDKPLSGGIYLLRIDKESAAWAMHFWQSADPAYEAFKHLLAIHKLQKTIKRLA